LIGRTAQTASTCVRDCRPVPITPSVCASALARSLVAMPLAAPVRIRPNRSASIIALSLPSCEE
jgi:hypothetical protein